MGVILFEMIFTFVISGAKDGVCCCDFVRWNCTVPALHKVDFWDFRVGGEVGSEGANGLAVALGWWNVLPGSFPLRSQPPLWVSPPSYGDEMLMYLPLLST